MWLVTSFVVSSVLIARPCLTGIIIETPKPQQLDLAEAAVNVLERCYVKSGIRTVGLAGISAGTISEKLWNQEHIPVTLIGKATRRMSHGPVLPVARYKLQIFVVTATSLESFAETVRSIRESRYWNHLASVLILDHSIEGCSNAYEVLWSAWEMDLLKAKFVCLDKTRGLLIYTYNPYNSKSPKPWRLDKTYSGKNNHTWTSFVRLYREDDRICDELDFDKTKDLNGYKIRSSVATDSSTVLASFSLNENGTVELGGISGKISQLIFQALNATPLVSHPTPLGLVDRIGKLHGGLAEVVNGISDISLNLRHQLDNENFTTSRNCWQSGISIITQYRGEASQLSKIASVLDVYSRYGLIVVCLITLIFFVYFMRLSSISVFLNTVRLVANSALPNIPNQAAPRIYLACLFIFMLTIQGIYQGQLASLLTKRVPVRNVNTLQDLIDMNYVPYGSLKYSRYFTDLWYTERYIDLEDMPECLKIVSADSTAACILDKIFAIKDATKLKLHFSKGYIVNLYWVYLFRDNWPPEIRVNTILGRLIAADLIRFIYRNETEKGFRYLEINESLENDKSLKVLKLEKLNFAFAILGIGLSCATVCFIIEMTINRARWKFIDRRKFARIRRK